MFLKTSWQTQNNCSIVFDNGIASPFALIQWAGNCHPLIQFYKLLPLPCAKLLSGSLNISEKKKNDLPIKVKTRKCPHPASHRLTLKLTVCFWRKKRKKTAVRCYGSLFNCSPALVVVYFEVWKHENFVLKQADWGAKQMRSNNLVHLRHKIYVVSKSFPTYPWNIPQTPHQQAMKEFLSFGDLGMPGVCSRGMLGLS